jgi:hypothetical protein
MADQPSAIRGRPEVVHPRDTPEAGARGAMMEANSVESDSERLDAAVRDALGLASDVDLRGVAYGSTEGWDSVGHLQLVTEIEVAFDIAIDPDDVVAMASYPAIRSILQARHGLALED